MRLQRQQAFAYANFKRNGAGSSALNSPTTPSTSILPIIKNNEQFALKSLFFQSLEANHSAIFFAQFDIKDQ